MELGDVFAGAAGGIERLIDAGRVFGAPITCYERTVVPVSTAWWCGGGGGGTRPLPSEGEEVKADTEEAGGGGFGGFGGVRPVGYIVLEEDGVRWERIIDKKLFILLGTLVLLSGLKILRLWVKIRGAARLRAGGKD